MGLPLESMGGKQAIDLMSKELSAKGANVLPGKIITGLLRNRKELTDKASSDIPVAFGEHVRPSRMHRQPACGLFLLVCAFASPLSYAVAGLVRRGCVLSRIFS